MHTQRLPRIRPALAWFACALLTWGSIAVLAWAVVYMWGCGLTPTERTSMLDQTRRESVAESTTADVVTASKVVPPTVTITQTGKDGSTVKVETPAATRENTTARTTATTEADTNENASLIDSITIPLYVKVIGLAVGIGMFCAVIGGAFWWLRRSSLAVRAATDKADAIVAGAIHKVRSEAINAMPGAETARLVTIAADLERDRSNALKNKVT